MLFSSRFRGVRDVGYLSKVAGIPCGYVSNPAWDSAVGEVRGIFPTLAISENFEKYKHLCAHTFSIYCIYRLYTHVYVAIQIFVYIKWPKIHWSPTKQWSTLHRIWGNNDSILESFEDTPGLVFKYGVNHLHVPSLSINCVWTCNMFNMFAFSTVWSMPMCFLGMIFPLCVCVITYIHIYTDSLKFGSFA